MLNHWDAQTTTTANYATLGLELNPNKFADLKRSTVEVEPDVVRVMPGEVVYQEREDSDMSDDATCPQMPQTEFLAGTSNYVHSFCHSD